MFDYFGFFRKKPVRKAGKLYHTSDIVKIVHAAINGMADDTDTESDRPSVRVVISTGINTYDNAMVSSIRVMSLLLGQLCAITNIKPNAIFMGDDTHIVLRYDCDMAIRDTVASVYQSVINALNVDYKAVSGCTALDLFGYDASTDDLVLFYQM